MQTWNLGAGDPLSLTLAADARLTNIDHTNDQIWELSLEGGEPAALALQTTFGLRARWMRLFPRFVRGETARTAPTSFHTPPRIKHFYPNSLTLCFAPFEGLEVQIEYRAAESQLLIGRIQVANQSILPQNFRLEWVALLNPIDRQGGMVPERAGPAHVLSGETAYLCPVVYLTGGPQPVNSPYPALALDLELYPGNARQFSWAVASLRTSEESLEAARTATARPWEAEQARIELLNASQTLEIQTGNPDWDAALALAQKEASALLIQNPETLPNLSFVLGRRPDHGFSLRGVGGDQNLLWGGQTALDSYYLAALLLPGAPEVIAGVIRNFLVTQDETGLIDWRPGLNGQRSRRLAQPMLASLAVQAAPFLKQPDWYQEIFPALLRFFNAWFSPRYDQDEDGFPEWEQPLQSGLEDSPLYNRWSPLAQGIEISRMESPALAAMLLSECSSLLEMTRVIQETEKTATAYARLAGSEVPTSGAAEAAVQLREREAALRALLESTWNPKAHLYQYRDYSTHLSPAGRLVAEFSGAGHATSRKRFGQPNRLVIQLEVQEERTYAASVSVQGFTAEGEITETLPPRSFTWLGTHARATTENTFLAVRRVQAEGLGESDQVRVLTADFTQEDLSLFLPLWAGAPDPEQARQMVEEALVPRYLQGHGLITCPPDLYPQEELPGLHTGCASALLPWNYLIGEGLLRYGYRAQAAALVTRLLDAAATSLKTHQAFRQYYHAETGIATGERGHLHGLPPVGLFLQVLGIRQLTQKEILIDGFNPFPGIIHVQYRKVHLTCHPDKTEITFPGGQNVVIDQPGSHRVVLS